MQLFKGKANRREKVRKKVEKALDEGRIVKVSPEGELVGPKYKGRTMLANLKERNTWGRS